MQLLSSWWHSLNIVWLWLTSVDFRWLSLTFVDFCWLTLTCASLTVTLFFLASRFLTCRWNRFPRCRWMSNGVQGRCRSKLNQIWGERARGREWAVSDTKWRKVKAARYGMDSGSLGQCEWHSRWVREGGSWGSRWLTRACKVGERGREGSNKVPNRLNNAEK